MLQGSFVQQASGSVDLGITSSATHNIDMSDAHGHEELPVQKLKCKESETRQNELNGEESSIDLHD